MPARLLSLIAPPLCGICRDSCGSAEAICRRCRAEIATAPSQPLTVPGVDRAWAAVTYEGRARELVAALKFGRRLALAGVAADAIATHVAGDARGTIVPVPADPWRHRLRGFDPAALIAEQLARRLGLPLAHCLARHHRRRQVGQARTERLTSDLGIRALAPPPVGAVLIDDVVTTGATLSACAFALRAAGAEEILALAFARA